MLATRNNSLLNQLLNIPKQENFLMSTCKLITTRCGVVVVGKGFLIVVVDDAAHVRHAAVADFHVVHVKDGVQIVVWWEVFLD